MSNTFHKTIYSKPELIERRRLRKLRGVSLDDIEIEEKIHPNTKKIIGKIQKEAKRGYAFTKICKDLIEETFSYPTDLSYRPESEHPIFSEYTGKKVKELLAYNPELTNVYFESPNDNILRLENIPLQPKPEITTEQLRQIIIRIWGIVYLLLPPPEYLATAQYVQRYCENIGIEIERTKVKIDIALIKPIPDIEDPSTH